MPNRYSDVNNCPDCRNKLWLRKVKDRYFYNCLSCGYEKELEKPKVVNPQTVFENKSIFDLPELADFSFELDA